MVLMSCVQEMPSSLQLWSVCWGCVRVCYSYSAHEATDRQQVLDTATTAALRQAAVTLWVLAGMLLPDRKQHCQHMTIKSSQGPGGLLKHKV
jgi:hypothetical protein